MTALLTIAATGYLEAAGETPEGLALVFDTIYNRSQLRKLPPEAICLQPKQYSCWNDRQRDDFIPPGQWDWKWALCLSLARQIVGGTYTPRLPVTHFHRHDVSPSWAARQTPVIVIGHHVFYNLS